MSDSGACAGAGAGAAADARGTLFAPAGRTLNKDSKLFTGVIFFKLSSKFAISFFIASLLVIKTPNALVLSLCTSFESNFLEDSIRLRVLFTTLDWSANLCLASIILSLIVSGRLLALILTLLYLTKNIYSNHNPPPTAPP